MESHDYVIVGGGTAASIVAYRLGERGHKVCVLEAGPADSSPYAPRRIPHWPPSAVASSSSVCRGLDRSSEMLSLGKSNE